MPNFLTRLAKRTLGLIPTVKPLIAFAIAPRQIGEVDRHSVNWHSTASEVDALNPEPRPLSSTPLGVRDTQNSDSPNVQSQRSQESIQRSFGASQSELLEKSRLAQPLQDGNIQRQTDSTIRQETRIQQSFDGDEKTATSVETASTQNQLKSTDPNSIQPQIQTPFSDQIDSRINFQSEQTFLVQPQSTGNDLNVVITDETTPAQINRTERTSEIYLPKSLNTPLESVSPFTQISLQSNRESLIQSRIQSPQTQLSRTTSSTSNERRGVQYSDSASAFIPNQLGSNLTTQHDNESESLTQTFEAPRSLPLIPEESRSTPAAQLPNFVSTPNPALLSDQSFKQVDEQASSSSYRSFYLRANAATSAVLPDVKPRLEERVPSTQSEPHFSPSPHLASRTHSEGRRSMQTTPPQSESTPESTVQVVIGRVVVRGASPSSGDSQPRARSLQQESRLSLEDYLRQREGESP
ncbi:MAG: hypothetical protein KME10_12170 [Plectolyngbya sp. WJT66-NPBG17]|nr:hypothetical protein [Plectolyngbya sp. WJT66-NPBG17]